MPFCVPLLIVLIAGSLGLAATARPGSGLLVSSVSPLPLPSSILLVPGNATHPAKNRAVNNDSVKDRWIPVPAWLGGTWRANSQIVLYSYNFQLKQYVVSSPTKIPIDRISTIGAQKEDNGQLWHYTAAPYLRVIETPAYIERQWIEHVSLSKNMPNLFSLRCLASVTHFDKKTFEVLDVFNEETVTSYEPLADGVIQVTFVVNDFDFLGHQRTASRSTCTEYRIKPFERVDMDKRGNLRRLFLDFLRTDTQNVQM